MYVRLFRSHKTNIKKFSIEPENKKSSFLIETKEILHKKKVEICISKRFGMKVRFNEKWYKITPISMQNKKSLKSNESVEAIIEIFIYFNCLKNERLSA